MKDIEIIAFDADDTLWSNEPFFQEIERKFADLLSIYKDTKEISAATPRSPHSRQVCCRR